MTISLHADAPDFSLPDQEGVVHSLIEERGKWVLLYFYPKDNTPGCTKEACVIRDAFPDFTSLHATVFGISVDTVKSHGAFAQKYHLPFFLLADERKEVVRAYGVYGMKKFMGREYQGTHRSSFLIDPQGKIAKIYENVKPESHAQQVIDDLRLLASNAKK